MHCVNSPENPTGSFSDVMVLERQTARLKSQQQQGCNNYTIGNEFCGVLGEGNSVNINNIQGGLMVNDLGSVLLANRIVKPDPGLQNGWAEMGKFDSCGYGTGTGVEANFGISRTLSCPPAMAAKPVVVAAAAAAVEGKGKESLVSGKSGSQVGKESSKKRKVDHVHNNIKDEDNTKDKKIKECPEDVKSKIIEQTSNKTEKKDCNNSTNNNKETSATTSKENSKVTDVQKSDYIHVRARRGQATDSHSLAERVRREKISERMKFLQDLVPGCNKITGKAGMLDEIINYVQSLQRQVEFLSMKLAAVSPRLDFDIDSIFAKELIPACITSFPAFDLSSEIASPSFLQINPMHQVVSCSGMEMGINPEIGIQRTLSLPETLLDSSCFNQIQPPSTWDADLQNIYDVEFHQARTPFPSHQYIGPESNLKMEL